MSRNKIILTSKSIVWMVDGVEADRIPMKPEYSIINGYVGIYESPILFEGEEAKAFDPFDGLSNVCNRAICCGFSEEQTQAIWKQKCQEQFIPDCTKRLIHALMTMHADFYNTYCKRKKQEQWQQLS